MYNSVKDTDKRFLSDRRKQPTPFISRYAFSGGQRKTTRRETDREKYNFVDVYSPHLFLTLLLLLILNISDGYLTLVLIKENIAAEINPIMAFFLEYDNSSFFMVKCLITSVPLFIFCICKNFSLAKASLASVIIIYLSIITYELNLIFQFLPPF